MAAQAHTSTRGRGRLRVAVVAALATGAAGLMVPLGGVAQATTGSKSYNCGKAYGAIAREDWSAAFDIAQPAAIYVGESVPLTLVNSSVNVHSNEGALWPGTYGGPFTIPMSFDGTAVTFAGNANGSFKAGGSSVPFNGSASWTAPATPGNVPVTMQNFSWVTNRNGGYTYQCSGTSTPKPYTVSTMVVKSKSHTTVASMPSTVYRRDVAPAAVNVSVDGGTPAGQVRITVGEGDKAVSEVRNVANGTAVVPVPTNFVPGTYPVKTEFLPSDSVHYDPSTATTGEIKILAARDSIAEIVVPEYVFDDEQGTVKVNMTAASGTPEGDVQLTVVGGATQTAHTNDQGVATFTLPKLLIGNHALSATFTPDNTDRFKTTTETGSVSVIAAAAHTATTLTLTRSEIQTTELAEVQAEVESTDLPVQPTGKVEFSVNGDLKLSATLNNGKVIADLEQLPVGEYTITAKYVPSEPRLYRTGPAASAQLSVVPPAATTTTTLTLERPESTESQTTELTARVQGGVSPVGDVVFQVNGTVTRVAVANGVARLTIPQLRSGEYPITARFEPTNTNHYGGSNAETNLLVVAPIQTETLWTTVPANPTFSQGVAVTVQVKPVSGVAEGVVEFYVGATLAATEEVPADGFVRSTLRHIEPGTHELKAIYVPTGARHATSTSAVRSVNVLDEAAVTLLSPAAIAPGSVAEVQATVSQRVGMPVGHVTFSVDGVGYRVEVKAGKATATIPNLVAGEYQVSASYESSDGLLSADALSQVTLVVSADVLPPTKPAVATTLNATISATSVEYGARPTLTVRVSPAASGWVRINVSGRQMSVQVVNGVATLALPELPVGALNISAIFVPANTLAFKGSQSNIALVVTKARARATVKAKAVKKKKGTVRVTTTLKAAAAQNFSGTVKFTIKPTKKALAKKLKKKLKPRTVRVGANGVAKIKFSKLPKGTYKVTATYSGSTTAAPVKRVKKVKVKR